MNTFEFYNLSVEMRGLMAHLEETGGELSPDLEAHLEALGSDLSGRLAEMALACRELNRTAEVLRGEEYRLRDRRMAKQKAETRLRELISDHMKETGENRVRTDLVTVSLVEGGESIYWDGKEENIPEPYRMALVEYVVDRELVLRHRAEGAELPEGMRVHRSRYIRIT